MIRFLKAHKIGTAITFTAIVLCGALLAVLVSNAMLGGQEEVPPGRIHDAGAFGEDIVVHDSTEGEIVIGAVGTAPLSAPLKVASDPDDIWTDDTYAGNHTPIEKAQMQNGSIGVLTIPGINLTANVYESPDNMEAMNKGIAHFPTTSAWDGNVSLSAHNINFDGSDGYFKNLHILAKGDSITYQTALGERTYTVESVTTITASDWTPLGYTDDHRLTLITCISGQPDKRLCVQAVEASQ